MAVGRVQADAEAAPAVAPVSRAASADRADRFSQALLAAIEPPKTKPAAHSDEAGEDPDQDPIRMKAPVVMPPSKA